MTSNTVHRGSLPFIHRAGSLSMPKADSPLDSVFAHNSHSHNFLTKLRARKQSTAQATITPAEAVWFLSLPDKVRRQHFTREEQILIRAKSELALLDTSPVALSHAEEAHHRTPRTRQRMHSVACDTSSRRPDFAHQPLLARQGSFDCRESLASSRRSKSQDLNMTPGLLQDGFRAPVYDSTPCTFLRSPTINNIRWETPEVAAPSTPARPEDTAHSPRHSNGPFVQKTAPSPSIQSKPLYVKDPSTKLFLRDCVSSERFEETLTFGFPTNSKFGLNLKAPYVAADGISPGTDHRLNWLDVPEEIEDESGLSSADEIQPDTPDALCDTGHDEPITVEIIEEGEEEVDDEDESLHPERQTSSASYFEELMKRDMTLRMTLTKPELRAPEEELYGWQEEGQGEVEEGKDPLALEKLEFSDDATGLKGAFAQHMSRKKGIKGLWFRK